MISKGLYGARLLFVLVLATTMAQAQEKPADTLPILPSVLFKEKQVKLSKSIKGALDSILHIVRSQGPCRIAVITGTTCHVKNGERSWDRVNAVVNYLVSKGIDSERIVCKYSSSNSNVALLAFRIEEDEIPSVVPPPYPNIRRRVN
jgi:outer membrane protein OmpA-like peptidoglycan-associated protein